MGEPSVNINNSLQSAQSDVATDSDLLQNRLIYTFKKDDPNNILDLKGSQVMYILNLQIVHVIDGSEYMAMIFSICQ